MSIFTGVPDIAADLISGTFGPIGAAAASLAEQTFTDNTVEEMKANNERYNEALNYSPRTDMGKAVNKGAMEAIGEGTAAVVDYYNENEEKIPDVVKSSVGAVADTWNDLDESTRFALGNLATVGEVVPIGKAASMLRRGSKLAPEDIMPDGVPTKDPMQPTPELQDGTSAPRLPAERAAMTPNVDELGYTSGIEEGIIAMINDPKVPDNVSAKQLMDLLKKRGVKDDEIEWSTFSDYVGTLGKKQLPLEEALRQARDRAITLEVIDMPEDKQKFYEYSPYGGDNYSEVLFKFDTTGKIREQREPLRSDRDSLEKELAELNAKRIDREVEIQEQQTLSPFLPRHLQSPSAVRARFDIGNAVKNEMPLSKVEVKKAEELKDINKRISDLTYDIERATFKKGHWRFTKNVDTSNVIFHARTTDREIGGDDSLAIDEIQSDWHQGKGDVQDRSYYKLPEDKLKPHIESIIKQADKVASNTSKKWKNLKEQSKELSKENQRLLRIIKENPEDQNAIAAFNDVRSKKKSLREQRVIIKRKGMAAELEYDEHKKQLSKLNEYGYVLFTKDLRPNAPLKNKDKWMGAALNAMLYKAVKGGYGSVSFPNGKTQSDLYRGNLDDNQIEALEKMYDTTVPNMLTKMAKKLDPNAKLIRGKDSSVTKPIPSRPVRAEAETEYTFEEWEEVLEEWEADANAGISTGKYDPVNSGYSYIEITVEMRDAVLKGKPLFLAEGGYVSGAADAVSGAVDVATDFLSGTFGPIGAAGASLAEQAFTDNTVEEMKANNEKYNDFLNYKPRTQMGRSANESFLETMGEGAEAVVNYYNENEENIPDAVKDTVGSVVDTWNDLDESTRFALGNLATVGEVLPMGKVASLAKRGISNASDTRRINRAASQVPDESEYYPVQDRLSAMGARQEMSYIEGQKGSATTQVATTVGSYKKAVKKAEDLNPKGKTVLDYGAGLGLGTDAMRSSSKLEVTSYEPFPERWKGDSPVDYTDSSLIPKKYDTVVNLNVLNVLEPELRDVVAKDIMSKVADGGVAIIGTRGWKGDIDATKKFKTTDEPQAIWVKKSSGDVYQKGFDGDELKDYMADLAPKGFRVERGKGIANNTVYVFNDNKPPKIDTEMEELADTSATKPKVIRFKDVAQPELSQEQLSKSFKNGEITAYGRNIARKRAATDMAGQTKQVRKLSEILGGLNVEGKTKITATQSDRTGILDGAGPGYPLIGRQYAEMAKLFQDEFGKAPVPKMLDENGEISDYPVWAVDDAGTMTSLMNNVSMENGLLVPMIGSVTQLRTNKEVFKKLKKEFMKGVKANKLSSEQAEKININLEALTGKKLDIREPSDWSSLENTFDDRGALADIMSGTKPILIGDKKWIKGREATNKDRAKSGLAPLPMNPKSVPLGGKKGQIFDYSKVLEDATEFILLGSKTFSLGPKIILPSRYGKTETMRDAHPGFEENAFGQVAHDGIFMPAPMEIVMPDFINFGHRKHLEEGKTTAFTPNQWGMNARMGYKGFGLPSQVIDEKYLKSLQDKGYNEGGLVEEMDSILE